MENPFDVIAERLTRIERLLAHRQTESTNKPVYLTVDKAADYLCKTPNALRVMVSKGQIKHIKKQSKLFFKQSDLIEWLESGRVENQDLQPEDILIKKNN